MLKLKETLSSVDKENLYLSNTPVGIFSGLFTGEDNSLLKYAFELCFGYYTFKSGNKTVSAIYDSVLNVATELNIENPIQKANEHITKLLQAEFMDKWLRFYNMLVEEEYNPLKDYDSTETKDFDGNTTFGYGRTDTKSGNRTDTKTYDTTIVDNGKTGTDTMVVTTQTTSADVYGFNSANPVGDSVERNNTNEHTTGEANKNTTFNENVKSGTDTDNNTYSETNTAGGENTETHDNIETITKTGRNTESAKLIQSEISMRNKNILFDIIYKDIDSVVTCPLYS